MSSDTNFLSLKTETINYALQIVCPSLGAFLAFAGLKKLFTKWDAAEATSRNNGFSTAEYYNIAILEVFSSLGLFFPRTRFVGVVILLSMIATLKEVSAQIASLPSYSGANYAGFIGRISLGVTSKIWRIIQLALQVGIIVKVKAPIMGIGGG
jgi:hypothetical protein